MSAPRIIVTPPSTSSASPFTPHSDTDTSSEVTEEVIITVCELETITNEEPCDVFKPLPPIPPEGPLMPDLQRRNTEGSTGSGGIRPADDLLTQVGVLRDSANAARSRRPVRGSRKRPPVYDGSSDEHDRRRASRLSRDTLSPQPPREAAAVQPGIEGAQPTIDTRSTNRTAETNGLLVDPVHGDGGPDDARRQQMRDLSNESSSSSFTWGSEKPTRKRDRLFRAPKSFFKRFCCLGTLDCTAQFHVIEFCGPRRVDRAESIMTSTTCAQFDSLMRSAPPRHLHLDRRSSLVSSTIIDVR